MIRTVVLSRKELIRVKKSVIKPNPDDRDKDFDFNNRSAFTKDYYAFTTFSPGNVAIISIDTLLNGPDKEIVLPLNSTDTVSILSDRD